MEEQLHDNDEWELCNDDGFVYKRKRRRLNDPTPAPVPEVDQEAADKLLKERKKRTLLKLKSKYEKEIIQWENLSNTLRSLQISVPPSQQLRQEEENQTLFLPSTSSSNDSSLIDDLLLQVEAQEAIIHDISNLCDIAEAVCFKQEQQLKQSLFDLPIWSTPVELMKALSDD